MSNVDLTKFAETIIKALVNNRKLMGYELSHARGLISEAELNEIHDRYLPIEKKPKNENEFFDFVELISTIFNCSPDYAEQTLYRVCDKWRGNPTAGDGASLLRK